VQKYVVLYDFHFSRCSFFGNDIKIAINSNLASAGAENFHTFTPSQRRSGEGFFFFREFFFLGCLKQC
jgi:hypothetical protein